MADVTNSRWSHTTTSDPDGTCHVDVCDEDGIVFPVARGLTPGQAERLVVKIAAESDDSRKPVKEVIRDPYFMAATVITLKRQAI